MGMSPSATLALSERPHLFLILLPWRSVKRSATTIPPARCTLGRQMALPQAALFCTADAPCISACHAMTSLQCQTSWRHRLSLVLGWSHYPHRHRTARPSPSLDYKGLHRQPDRAPPCYRTNRCTVSRWAPRGAPEPHGPETCNSKVNYISHDNIHFLFTCYILLIVWLWAISVSSSILCQKILFNITNHIVACDMSARRFLYSIYYQFETELLESNLCSWNYQNTLGMLI